MSSRQDAAAFETTKVPDISLILSYTWQAGNGHSEFKGATACSLHATGCKGSNASCWSLATSNVCFNKHLLHTIEHTYQGCPPGVTWWYAQTSRQAQLCMHNLRLD